MSALVQTTAYQESSSYVMLQQMGASLSMPTTTNDAMEQQPMVSMMPIAAERAGLDANADAAAVLANTPGSSSDMLPEKRVRASKPKVRTGCFRCKYVVFAS